MLIPHYADMCETHGWTGEGTCPYCDQQAEQSTWSRIMAHDKDDKRHQRRPNEVANDLNDDELATILAAIEFFGADDRDIKQVYLDLKVIRYRVFDWLAMCVMGRLDCRQAVQVLAYSFLKSEGDVDKFIADLRSTDYEVVTDWEALKV